MGCAAYQPLCPPPATGDVVYVVGQGWHTEIGIPVEQLQRDLAFYREVFKDARVILFGYGKRTFVTAPPDAISEYVIGPFPGPAVIQAIGLRVTPVAAYPADDVLVLSLPPGGNQALLDFIADDLGLDAAGKPRFVALSQNPAGAFYAAVSRYNLWHTCNSWAAEALQHAGVGIQSDGVVFAAQAMARAREAAHAQCVSP